MQPESKKALIITVIVVAVIAIIGVALWIGYRGGREVTNTQQQENETMNPAANDTNSLSNTTNNSTDNSVADDESSWLNFTNSTSAYSLKYPTDWETVPLAVVEPRTGALGIRPKTIQEDYILLINEYQPLLEPFNTTVKNFKDIIADNSKNITQTTTTQFGKSNVTKISYTNNVSGYNYSEYFLTVGNKTYGVTGESNDPANVTANKILDTLSFK